MPKNEAMSVSANEPVSDSISKIIEKNLTGEVKWQPSIVEEIFTTELLPSEFATRKLALLESNQYLEKYLWPHFSENASINNIVSICLMVTEKIRQNITWEVLEEDTQRFSALFHRVTQLLLIDDLPIVCQCELFTFLTYCFQRFENVAIRTEYLKFVTIGIWTNLISDVKREKLFIKYPSLQKLWNSNNKKLNSAGDSGRKQLEHEMSWLSLLLKRFVPLVYKIPTEGEVDEKIIRCCERFVEFLTTLEIQLPTRRFFNSLLNDYQVVVLCQMAPLSRRANQDVDLLKELIDNLSFYSKFSVNDQTGIALNEQSMKEDHYRKLLRLQHVSFRKFKEQLKELSLTNLGSIETREDLLWHFESISGETLAELCNSLEIRSQPVGIDIDLDLKDYLIEVLIAEYEKPENLVEKIKNQPIYPDEKTIFGEKLIQMSKYRGDRPLALPRLNLQYLTLGDYLLRNYKLFRLESIYNIRQDIEDAVKRLSPRMKFPECKTEFAGKARMATLIDSFNIVDIADAKLGDDKPAHVRADVTFNIGTYARNMRNEWDSLRKQDTLYLVTIEATEDSLNMMTDDENFREHYGIKCIRGCEIVDFIGADGRSIDEISRPTPEDRKDKLKGSERTIRVELDPNQYKVDMNNFTKKHSDDIYSTFNVLIRRKTEENSSKSMLETICELLQAEATVPDWLYKVFLGYGDQKPTKKSKKTQTQEAHFETIQIESRKLPSFGPYGDDNDMEDQAPLSPKHREAIFAGMNNGLTIITGSSDTEKIDIAANVVASLYRNFPKQKTLVVTHSNSALDALFEKVPEIGVKSQHIIRIGHGDQELSSEVSFSKYSRISVTLERRVALLQEVDQLASSLNVSGEHGSTCETAGHFYKVHIEPRWESFLEIAKSADSTDKISSAFPFSQFYAHSAKSVFTESMSVEEALESANGCKRYFDNLFGQLESIRPFELLRYDYDRANYLLTKETRVIGVLSAHTTLKRPELVKHRFKYDNIVVLEADQILEIETFISLQLQEPNDASTNLKRITIIGDNKNLPTVNNAALEKYGNLNQSMFKRFAKLGVPAVCLD